MVEVLTIGDEEIASLRFDELNSPRFTMPDHILWPLPPERFSLGATDVHVWAARLDLPSKALVRLEAMLFQDESERAARFRFETHRNRFIAARGILRSLLGHYLHSPPDELRFEYGPNGKPTLASPFVENGVSFNLAHSEDLALVAVTRLGLIGVDVEQIRPIADADELVARFFSPRETAIFQTLPRSQKNAAFFNLWTRKEAWLKATGDGIAHLLNRVEVTFLPGDPAHFLSLPKKDELNSDWALRELTPATGFVGAVALPDFQFSICNYQFAIPELL
jgi:4'-phosphopantetheinyl transferase